jgi:hypothetical protein
MKEVACAGFPCRCSASPPVLKTVLVTEPPALIQPSMDYQQIGKALASHLNETSGAPSVAALQGMIADLAADQTDLVAPLKDLVSRQSFRALIPNALSGGGAIQRDALVKEISRVYHPAVLIAIEEVLNGFLESSGGIASQLSQSVFIELHPPTTKSDDRQLSADSRYLASRPSLNESTDRSQLSNVAQASSGAPLGSTDPFFEAALHIARTQSASNLGSASATNSGKGVIHYVIRDSGGIVLYRVALAMVDARLSSLRASPPSQQQVISQVDPANASDQFFQKAIAIAKQLGNENLGAASASASRAGLANYVIRDSYNTILAQVPLSMVRNAMN